MSTGQESNRCERHPEEIIVARCINCNRGICRSCLKEFGYFCSEDCKQKTKQETQRFSEAKEEKEFPKFPSF